MNKQAIAAPALSPQLFSFDSGTGGSISLSAFEKDGSIWFSANDVCKALGLDPTAVRRLDEDERNTLRIAQPIRRGNPNISIINESGLYALIFKSRKDGARKFQKWITSQVIPTIRKHGGYINGMESLQQVEQHEAQKEIQRLAAWAHQRHVEDKEARAEALRFLRRR